MNVFLCLSFVLAPVLLMAQSEDMENPSPKTALLRSLVVPGWGHHYVDKSDWNRGKVHLTGEVLSILSLVGLDIRISQLDNNLETIARSKAGTSLKGMGRAYEIALSNFNSLEEYNDFQLRARNWNDLIPDTPETYWSWQSLQDRLRFADTRSRISRSQNQIPVIITVMAANRLFSGINAFRKARELEGLPQFGLRVEPDPIQSGITAQLRFEF